MIRFFLSGESVLHDQTKHSITFCIDSRLDQIRLIRAALSGVLRHLGVVESDVFALELALTEIINNTLEHGYQGAQDKPVEVQVAITGSEVRIVVADNAPPFPEAQRHRLLGAPQPIEDPSEEWPMRGHGLQIVRQIVDSIDLKTEQNRNFMTITKQVGIEAS